MLAGNPVESAELARKIQFEGQQSGGDLEVRIRSDRTVAYRYVEPILLACARSGVWNVAFAVVPREGR
jgi:biopolymer transport protein ExbD